MYLYLFILSTIVQVLLYLKWPAFRYFSKMGFLYFYSYIVAGCFLPYFMIRGRSVHHLKLAAKTIGCLTHPLGVKWTIRNSELLKEPTCCIMVGNHQSSIDIIGMFQFWRYADKMTVISTREVLMQTGFIGICCWFCKLIFINRKKPGTNKELVTSALKELKATGTKLWFFPEGTRHNDDKIHAFKKGAFLLAVQFQVPVQPVVFSSYKPFLDVKGKRFDSGKVIVTVLPRIPTEGLTEEDVPALVEKVKAQMDEVHAKTTMELYGDKLK